MRNCNYKAMLYAWCIVISKGVSLWCTVLKCEWTLGFHGNVFTLSIPLLQMSLFCSFKWKLHSIYVQKFYPLTILSFCQFMLRRGMMICWFCMCFLVWGMWPWYIAVATGPSLVWVWLGPGLHPLCWPRSGLFMTKIRLRNGSQGRPTSGPVNKVVPGPRGVTVTQLPKIPWPSQPYLGHIWMPHRSGPYFFCW